MTENLKTAKRVCRLLYYGPAQAGKRENLRVIHQSVPPEQRLTLAGDDPERQIAFQVQHGEGERWQVLVHSVDSGKERYRSAGMSPIPPFDGIVFVVNSSAAALDRSLEAFEGLKAYLESWDLDLMGVPLVIQYNRRDQADTLRVDRLESLLNPWGLLSFPANAKKGEGVREALKAILGLTVNHLETQPEDNYNGRETLVEPEDNSVAVADKESGLGIDYGPPLPDSVIGQSTKTLSDAIYEELRPPVIIPVKIPRRLLEGQGPLRILLEVEVDDSEL
ncbi:MAG: hypothetical protein QNL91_06405 [Candidatus Krumholzibacteria bacterium]|nr:hypothetical protein [Candidatus Krumholzibacteria bacterium]